MMQGMSLIQRIIAVIADSPIIRILHDFTAFFPSLILAAEINEITAAFISLIKGTTNSIALYFCKNIITNKV